VIATVLVLIFASDVSRAAHDEPTALRSQDASFVTLANTLISQENAIDSALTSILVRGSSLNRSQLYAQLLTLRDQMAVIPAEAAEVRYPVLAHGINEILATWCQARVRAYGAILANVAQGLSLPWSGATTLSVAQADTVLKTTATNWSSLIAQQGSTLGAIPLSPFSDFSGILDVNSIVQQLAATAQLKVSRSLALAALSITPAPFPSNPGQLLEPTTATLSLGVSVLNGAFVTQGATITATLTASNGHSVTRTQGIVLGPRDAVAVTPLRFAVWGGEHATLVVRVTGAPATPGYQTVRSYLVTVAPTVINSQG
jgi:hypothetical protein